MLAEFRAALRTLRRAPAFTATTVLTLGLGIGASTALFTAVRGVLLRPLPYPAPDRLVEVSEVNAGGRQVNVADPNFVDWRRSVRSLGAMAEWQAGREVVVSPAGAAQVPVASVSRDFFDVLRVHPAVGRGFVPEEQVEGAAPAVIVSHALWRRAGGDGATAGSRALGRLALTVDGTPMRVVGVMPDGFDYPGRAAVWMPRELQGVGRSRTAHNYHVVARLADGATLDAARRELSAATRALQHAYGREMHAVDAAVTPLHDTLVGRTRVPLLLLFAAAGVLLLVAATNVATLLTARAEGQRRELGVRVAVGATAGRLARQFLAEAGLVAAGGAVVGVAIAALGTRLLVAAGDAAAIARPNDVRVDPLVVGFAFAVAALATGALGGAVAIRAVRDVGAGGAALVTGERAGTTGRHGTRVRSALVAAQVALTAVLLVGAGLLARSFVRLVAVDPGFRTTHAVAVSLRIPGAPAGDTADDARTRATVDALVGRLRALPGVRAAGGVTVLPVGDAGQGNNGTFVLQSRPDEVRNGSDFGRLADDPSRAGQAEFRTASDGYFEAMRIPLLRGRTFEARDVATAAPVAVISASLARARFAGRDPLGALVQFGNMDGDYRPMTVVGVVGDVREQGLDVQPNATVYALTRQRGRRPRAFSIILAGGGGFDEAATARAARRVAAAAAPSWVVEARPIEQVFARSVATRRYVLLLAGAFAVAALALAVTGLYGIVAYVVAQRRRELGVRVALGARGADVRRLVLGRGLAPAALGLAAGLVAALGLGQLLTAQLYEVKPADPVTYAGVALALAAAALGAAWGPARSAARADPLDALRAE